MASVSLAAVAAAEAAVGCLLARDLLEGIAREVRAARVDGTAEGIAVAQGCRVFRRAMPRGLHGFRGPRGAIFVATHRDPAVERLVLLHQLAHVMLRACHVPHSIGDVWAVTLALAMPPERVREATTLRDLAAIEGVPVWAAAIRAPGLDAGRTIEETPPKKSVQGY